MSFTTPDMTQGPSDGKYQQLKRGQFNRTQNLNDHSMQNRMALFSKTNPLSFGSIELENTATSSDFSNQDIHLNSVFAPTILNQNSKNGTSDTATHTNFNFGDISVVPCVDIKLKSQQKAPQDNFMSTKSLAERLFPVAPKQSKIETAVSTYTESEIISDCLSPIIRKEQKIKNSQSIYNTNAENNLNFTENPYQYTHDPVLMAPSETIHLKRAQLKTDRHITDLRDNHNEVVDALNIQTTNIDNLHEKSQKTHEALKMHTNVMNVLHKYTAENKNMSSEILATLCNMQENSEQLHKNNEINEQRTYQAQRILLDQHSRLKNITKTQNSQNETNKNVHFGLENHRDALNDIKSETKNISNVVDTYTSNLKQMELGLKNHKENIQDLHQTSKKYAGNLDHIHDGLAGHTGILKSMHTGLKNHQDEIQKVLRRINAEPKDNSKEVEEVKTACKLQSNCLQSLHERLNAHENELEHLSRGQQKIHQGLLGQKNSVQTEFGNLDLKINKCTNDIQSMYAMPPETYSTASYIAPRRR